MQFIPDLQGHGASQRAWYQLDALCRRRAVDIVLLLKPGQDFSGTAMEQLPRLARSTTRIVVPGWVRKGLGARAASVMRAGELPSHVAPQLTIRELTQIADQLPYRSTDLVFAGRLGAAVIAENLIRHRLLEVEGRIWDLDGFESLLRRREMRLQNLKSRLSGFLEARYLERMENELLKSWDAVSFCSPGDVEMTRSRLPAACPIYVPNVIQRPALPRRGDDGEYRLLFVGNLGYLPNVLGLRAFLAEAWPRVRAALPHVTLDVVGMKPNKALVRVLEEHGARLHADVPLVEPYYAACDLAISPISAGAGTRVKIIEAMAFERPVVSTAMAAEGLGAEPGRDLVIAQDMTDFADALIRLAGDPEKRREIALAGRRFVSQEYGPEVMYRSMEALLAAADTGERSADALRGGEPGHPRRIAV